MGSNYNTSPVPWYYVYNDIIKGPVTIGQMQRDYYIYRELHPGTMVWTDGMAEWTPLSSTELINHIMFAPGSGSPTEQARPPYNGTYTNQAPAGQAYPGSQPGSVPGPAGYPPGGYIPGAQVYPGQHIGSQVPPGQYPLQKINNTYMWLIVGVAGIGNLIYLLARDVGSGFSFMITIIMVGLYALFCSLDKNELQRSGHRTTSVWWFLIVPVYMFVRAYRVRQVPSYAIVFLVISFVVGFIYGFVNAFFGALL
ncbi:hypothetical protein YSY43_11720 [Paenibacillus sp. YSY-4.3]